MTKPWVKEQLKQIMAAAVIAFGSMGSFSADEVVAQPQCMRIMKQDLTLNNLVDPAGYKVGQLGELGGVIKVGNGKQAMIFIPGLGFSGEVFRELMEPLGSEATMYAVTLPGFGGTAAPPTPPEGTSFGEQTWTNGAYQAIEKLIETEKLERPIIVGHWLTGTTLALKLAVEHPEKIAGVNLLAGASCFVPTDTTQFKLHMPLEKIVAVSDKYMAPMWFKTVTRETWDDNNFLPGDYAVNPIRGLRLWRMAAEPELHVWVRYLVEFNAQDISQSLGKLSVPVLLLKPGLEGNYSDPGQDYMTGYCHTGWNATLAKVKNVEAKTIANARACLWFDQPEAVDAEVRDFLARVR